MPKLLILGGTGESADLAERVGAGRTGWRAITSLAGRTDNPAPSNGEIRIGGFGGGKGLIDYLRSEAFDAVIDATHPYAEQMTRQAAEAARAVGVPHLRLHRPGFDLPDTLPLTHVPNMQEAARALKPNARVFLAIGKRGLEAFADRKDGFYVLRTVTPFETPPPLNAVKALIGPPRDKAGEIALLKQYDIDTVVSKDSGGAASAKFEAALETGASVILIDRPAAPDCETVPDVEEALAWLKAL